jgi:hypothetical protein
MLIDDRIGTYDGEEPLVCAVSGELVRGRPSSQYGLDAQHYYRVLAKRENGFDGANRTAKETELKQVIEKARSAELAEKTTPVIAEPPASRRVRAGEERES